MKLLFQTTLLFVLVFSINGFAKQTANLNSVYRLMDNKQYKTAALNLAKLVKQYPDDADAWYFYGLALYRSGDLKRAEHITQKVAQFEGYAKYADFNLGLIAAQRGDLEKAMHFIQLSRHKGYINYDRLHDEEALAKLRQQGKIEFAPAHDYQEFTAYNRIKIPHKILLPQNYDPDKPYKGMIAFPPGDFGHHSADWMIENLLNSQANHDWIITVVVAPKDGLINHPAHHALNDLMKNIRKKHHIKDNRFYFLGYQSGSSPAATYSQMSRSYVNGVTTIGAYAWENWKDDNLDGFHDLPTQLLVGKNDTIGVKINQHAYQVMKTYKSPVTIKLFENEGGEITSLANGKLFDLLN